MKIRTSKGDEFEALSAAVSEDVQEMTITIRDDMDMNAASERFRDLDYIEADGEIIFGSSYFLFCTHYIGEHIYKIVIERRG